MTIIIWLCLIVIVAGVAAVWRSRARGPGAMRQAIVILIVALVAVGFTSYIVRGR